MTPTERAAIVQDALARVSIEAIGRPGVTPEARLAACRRDLDSHLEALSTSLARGGAAEFAEYAAWIAVFLEPLGVPPLVLDQSFAALADACASLGGAAAGSEAVAAAFAAARERLASSPLVTPAEVADVAPLPGATGPAADLDAVSDAAAKMSVALAYARRPHDALSHGAKRSRCLEDARFHLAQLREAARLDAPAVFAEYAAWVRSVLVRHGVAAEELVGYLGALRDVVVVLLGVERAVSPLRCIDAALERLAGTDLEIPSFLREDNPRLELARVYVEALLAGDRRRASALVVDAAEGGAPIRDLYVHVFQPAQYEVGRLWQQNVISVAQEHFCSASTQMVMSQLYSRVFGASRRGLRLVATCVQGNLHEIGARFVADFFEMDGWDSYYLGANMPTEHVLRDVAERRADLVAISATLFDHVEGVRQLVAALRGDPATRGTAILVGGHPFRMVPTLWRDVGADGFSADAAGAVEIGNRLVARRR